MNILIIDNGTKHLGHLKELFSNDKVEVYKLFSKYPNFQNYDLIVLSGGSQISIINAPEVFAQEIELIKKSDIPIIGICQGCEIIAYTFDSKLTFLNHKSKGIKNIKLLPPLTEFAEQIDVYEAHSLSISEVSNDLIVLGNSKEGIEIIKHKDKKIIGVQFHPEMMTDQTLGDELFKKMLMTYL